MSSKIIRLKQCFQANGCLLTVTIYYRKILNKLYNRLIIGRSNTHIDSRARILGLKNITIGDNFSAGRGLWLEAVTENNGKIFSPKIIIGNEVSLSDYNHIGATHYIEIGNHVLMGSKCYITDHNHGVYRGLNQSPVSLAPANRALTFDGFVIIEDNVWIGDNVTILPNVRIGYGTIIGANSVVTKNIPPFSIAVGIPAHVVKKYSKNTKKWIPIKSGD